MNNPEECRDVTKKLIEIVKKTSDFLPPGKYMSGWDCTRFISLFPLDDKNHVTLLRLDEVEKWVVHLNDFLRMNSSSNRDLFLYL